MHWMPVVWIEVPPVLVDQALKLWAEKDVDGTCIDGMEEAVEGAGYVSELVLPVVDSRCYFALGEPPVVPESELGAEPVTVGS